VCAAADTKFLFEKSEHPVFRCAACRLEFLYPQPTDDVLASIYGAQYFLGDESAESDERVGRLKTATALRYLHFITQRLPEGKRRILEIGCGHGDLLFQAQILGFEVRGIEFSPSAVAVANRRLGAGVVQAGTSETVDMPQQYFDVVVASDVLEHVRDPRSFLSFVYERLKPGGLVFLITPSPDSWSRKLLGRHWMEYKVEHLFYLSKTALDHLLKDTGFEAVSFSANRKVLSLDYLDSHFRRFPVPLCTPILRAIRRVLPDVLAHRQFTISASGLMAMGWKRSESLPTPGKS
jgi:SAM-dependent methyltransferase